MIRKTSGKLKHLAALLVLGVLPSTALAATVDLLILYDTYSRNYFSGDPQTAMNSWVSQMNAAYRDSQVDIQLRLVGVRAHEQAGANMDQALSNLRVDAQAIALRDQLGADFVSQLHQTGACGLGYVAIDRNWTWNVVGPNCGPLTMAHEIGHNMGLNHSRRQGNTTGARYRYGLGYGVDNQFGTIMAYAFLFNAPRVGRFSNPNLRCGSAQLPCGVPVGDPNEAYAALALQNVRDEIAGFRPTVGSGSGGGPIGYTRCAGEGGTCSFSGKQAVAYGANGSYFFREPTGSIGCNNTAFSGDPLPGVVKSCFVTLLPPGNGWTQCASENGTCTVPSGGVVTYGAATNRFYQRFVTTSIACNNTTWGDPAPGALKACYRK